ISILGQNSKFHTIPLDGKIKTYGLEKNSEIDRFSRPEDVPGNSNDTYWRPYVLSNGTLRFFSNNFRTTRTFNFTDSGSNNLGSVSVNFNLENITSTGGIGGFNKQTNYYIFGGQLSDQSYPDEGINGSSEVVVFNMETYEVSHFSVDWLSNLLQDVKMYNGNLYAIYQDSDAVNLLRANNGKWDIQVQTPATDIDLTDEYSPSYLTYFLHEDSYFEIRSPYPDRPFKIQINQWNLTSFKRINSFIYETEYIYGPSSERYNIRNVNFWLSVYYEEEFRIQQTESGILFDYYYHVLSFDYNDFNDWTVSKLIPREDELIINSYPLNETSRLEIVTVFLKSWTSSQSESILSRLYNNIGLIVILILIILLVKMQVSSSKSK
ncbi:MAG: hypothetical protein ACXAC2_18165, partial [Candidatus Kariarchaeaceae archaeon]